MYFNMYLKREYIDEAVKKDFSENHHAEFAWAYYQKTKDVESVELAMVTFERDEKTHKRAIIKQKYLSDINQNKLGDKFIDIGGNKPRLSSSYLINPNYDYKENEITNIELKTLSEVEFKEMFGTLNTIKLEEANGLMQNFCNLKDQGVIYSKEGEEFSYKIIENSDMTLGSLLLLDELRVYKDNVQIGFLKTKYTNDSIIKELLGQDYQVQINDNMSADEKKAYLKEKEVVFTETNYDIIFNIKKNELKDQLKKIQRELKMFNDVATIDYSKISDEFKGKGLGTQIYLKMAEHYDNKNIVFRSSSLQSPSAKGLWEKMKKEYPSQIEEINIADQNYYKLKGSGQKDKVTHKRRNKKTL